MPPNRAAAASHPTSDQIRRFREEIEKQHSEPERRRDKGSVRHGEPASRGRTNRRRR